MAFVQPGSAAYEAGARAQAIRQRLTRPPNAVIDTGINLKTSRIRPVFVIKPEEKPKPVQVKPKPLIVFQYASIAEIRHITCQYYAVPVDQIVADCRKPYVAIARHVAIYLARSKTKKSWGEIVPFFGYRDHTTLLHSWKVVSKRLAAGDPELQLAVDVIWTTINAHRNQPAVPAKRELRVAYDASGQAILPFGDIQELAETSAPSMAYPETSWFPDHPG